jgi:hypothetical protein
MFIYSIIHMYTEFLLRANSVEDPDALAENSDGRITDMLASRSRCLETKELKHIRVVGYGAIVMYSQC